MIFLVTAFLCVKYLIIMPRHVFKSEALPLQIALSVRISVIAFSMLSTYSPKEHLCVTKFNCVCVCIIIIGCVSKMQHTHYSP